MSTIIRVGSFRRHTPESGIHADPRLLWTGTAGFNAGLADAERQLFEVAVFDELRRLIFLL